MTLTWVSIVIDDTLWSDDWDDQMNALTQGLLNARGRPKKYPIRFKEFGKV